MLPVSTVYTFPVCLFLLRVPYGDRGSLKTLVFIFFFPTLSGYPSLCSMDQQPGHGLGSSRSAHLGSTSALLNLHLLFNSCSEISFMAAAVVRGTGPADSRWLSRWLPQAHSPAGAPSLRASLNLLPRTFWLTIYNLSINPISAAP